MGHKRKMIEGSPGVQLSLIITPMLDMSFQILAFFIMTYHPSALEGHIPGSLVPPEKMLTKSKDNVVTPLDDPLPSLTEDELNTDLNDAFTVQIKAMVPDREPKWRLEGMASQYSIRSNLESKETLVADVADANYNELERAARIEFKVPAHKEPTNAMINKKWDDKMIGRLEAKLKEVGTKGTKANLKIAGDGNVKQRYIMAAFDAGKKAGFSKIHFVPPPVLNSKIQSNK